MTTNVQGSFNDKIMPDPDGEVVGMIVEMHDLKEATARHNALRRAISKLLPDITEPTRFIYDGWAIRRTPHPVAARDTPEGISQGRMIFDRLGEAPSKPEPRSGGGRRGGGRRNPNEPRGPAAIAEQRRAHEATGA